MPACCNQADAALGVGSSWRPSHRPPPEQVQVEMEDGLSGASAAVDDEAIPAAGLLESVLPGQPIGKLDRLAQERRVRRRDLRETGEVLGRNDQQVRGGLRVTILKGQETLFLGDDLRLDLPFRDSTEQAITFSHAMPSPSPEVSEAAVRQEPDVCSAPLAFLASADFGLDSALSVAFPPVAADGLAAASGLVPSAP